MSEKSTFVSELDGRIAYDASDVDSAFNPKGRQAEQDFRDYLEQRPYRDSQGNACSPDGRPMPVDETADKYYSRLASETLAATSWDNMGLVELAKMVYDAEQRGDWTTAIDARDTIAERLEALGWSEDAIGATSNRLNEIMKNGEPPKQSTPNQEPTALTAPTTPPRHRGGTSLAFPKPAQDNGDGSGSSAAAKGGIGATGEKQDLPGEVSGWRAPGEWWEELTISPGYGRERAGGSPAHRFFVSPPDGVPPAQGGTGIYGVTESRSEKIARIHGGLPIPGGNQDAYVWAGSPEPGYLFCGVFDGVGRGNLSKVISQTAAGCMREFASGCGYGEFSGSSCPLSLTMDDASRLITDYFWTAKGELNRVAEQSGVAEDSNQDTTGVVAFTFADKDNGGRKTVCIGHIGDSRAYLVRKGKGEAIQLTNDHGEGNVIYGGMRGGSIGSPDVVIVPLCEDDTILLVSDGVTGDKPHELLSTSEIGRLVRQSTSLERVASNLLGASRKIDDSTICVIRT